MRSVPRPPPPRRTLPFFLAQFLIRANAVELIFAHQWTHFCLALERWSQTNRLCFRTHSFHKFRIDRSFHQNPAPCRAHFPLVDEHAEKRSINRRLEIGIGEKYVR